MATETWLVDEHNEAVHPSEVERGKDGRMRTKDGRAIKMRSPAVPMSRSVDPEEEKAKAGSHRPRAQTRDMKAEEPRGQYKTRDV